MSKLTRTIKIDEDIWKDAKKLAIDEDTNFSSLIEDLLNKELKKKKTVKDGTA
jgi:predicted CopG family antitoxin